LLVEQLVLDVFQCVVEVVEGDQRLVGDQCDRLEAGECPSPG